VDTGCENATCQAGQVCVAGACVDACEGAVCPGGAECVNGQCGPSNPNQPNPSGVGDGGVSIGDILTDGTTASPGSGTGSNAGAQPSGDSNEANRAAVEGPGCACVTVGRTSHASGALVLPILLWFLRYRRRRAD
jgi:MYXO-CTERM domain-containing protein